MRVVRVVPLLAADEVLRVGECRDNPAVRVAVITGAGEKFFCAGWDLGAAAEGEAFDSDYGAGGFGGFTNLPARRTPVIAAVNGMAVGGGFEIAMAADMVARMVSTSS